MPDNEGKPQHFSGPPKNLGFGMAEVYRQIHRGLVGKTITEITFGDVDVDESFGELTDAPGEYIDFKFSDGTNLVLMTAPDASYFVDLKRSTSHRAAAVSSL